jgi:hypothetical protein
MTFTAQTGYKRSGPVAICQDIEALLAVREFSFDLTDEDFVRYFEDRTGVRITWSPRCGYKYPNPPFACSEKEWAKVCADIAADTDTPTRILRGKLEDAWELWQAELERERDTRKVARLRGAFPARNVPATKQDALALAQADCEPTNLVFAEFDADEYIVTASPAAV